MASIVNVVFDVLVTLNLLSSIGSENLDCNNANLETRNEHICRGKILEVVYSNRNLNLCGDRRL